MLINFTFVDYALNHLLSQLWYDVVQCYLLFVVLNKVTRKVFDVVADEGLIELKDTPLLSSPLQGHIDELWGLAVHPWKPQFLTCGYDRQVSLWDSSTHQLIWTKSMEVL